MPAPREEILGRAQGFFFAVSDRRTPATDRETHPVRAGFGKLQGRNGSRGTLFDARPGIVVESESAIKYLKGKKL